MSVNIGLLGDFRLEAGGRPLLLSARKSRALLAWMLCQGPGPQPRDRLAALLWEDRTPVNARASLRQAIAGLRKVLPAGVLVSSTAELRLDQDAVQCDLLALRQAIAQPGARGLRPVLTLYRGDLLDGFSANAGPFDDWLLLEREQLRQSTIGALKKLLGMEEDAESHDAAIEVASRLLSLDPLQEDVHRSLMRLFAAQGQLGSARRQFKLCRDVLEKELQRPPARETLVLFQALGRDAAPLGVSPTGASPTGAAPTGAVAPPPAAADAALTADPQEHMAPAATSSAPGLEPRSDRRAALPGLAVLPFQSRSDQTEHGYLADGMTEELINLLAGSANWRVASRSQSFRYRGEQPDARDVGERLGVAYVIDGTIRASSNRVRISASLVTTEDGAQLWSERYDRPLDDLFDIQDEVARAIFRTLKLQLGVAERERVRRAPRTSLNAWGLLIRAMQIQVVDMDTRNAQIEMVEESLAVDPDYPRAHGYLASLLFASVGRRSSPNPKEDLERARVHLEAALQHGASDPVTLQLGAAGLAAVGEAPHTLALARRASELRGNPDPLLVAALTWNGQLDEAFRLCQELLTDRPDDSPLAPGEFRPMGLLGNLYMLKGDLHAALDYALRDQRANPANFFAHLNVANVQGLLGNATEARTAWRLAKRIVPSLTVKLFDRSYRKVCTDPKIGAMYAAGLIAAGVEEESA